MVRGNAGGPWLNASQAGDTPSAFASDSITSMPDCPPFSILAKALGLRLTSRQSAAFVRPLSMRTDCNRAPMPSDVTPGPSVVISPMP